jgi:hypothetical protein
VQQEQDQAREATRVQQEQDQAREATRLQQEQEQDQAREAARLQQEQEQAGEVVREIMEEILAECYNIVESKKKMKIPAPPPQLNKWPTPDLRNIRNDATSHLMGTFSDDSITIVAEEDSYNLTSKGTVSVIPKAVCVVYLTLSCRDKTYFLGDTFIYSDKMYAIYGFTLDDVTSVDVHTLVYDIPSKSFSEEVLPVDVFLQLISARDMSSTDTQHLKSYEQLAEMVADDQYKKRLNMYTFKKLIKRSSNRTTVKPDKFTIEPFTSKTPKNNKGTSSNKGKQKESPVTIEKPTPKAPKQKKVPAKNSSSVKRKQPSPLPKKPPPPVESRQQDPPELVTKVVYVDNSSQQVSADTTNVELFERDCKRKKLEHEMNERDANSIHARAIEHSTLMKDAMLDLARIVRVPTMRDDVAVPVAIPMAEPVVSHPKPTSDESISVGLEKLRGILPMLNQEYNYTSVYNIKSSSALIDILAKELGMTDMFLNVKSMKDKINHLLDACGDD